jgi:PKD repeat protein
MMKKITLLFLTFLMVLSFAKAQQLQYWCATSEVNNAAMQNDPNIAPMQQQLEEFTKEYMKNNHVPNSNRSSGVPQYIIPVVVHVIHDCGVENISDAQIHDMMRIINEDYAKLNADTIDIAPAFQGIAADCEIEFRLARIDPNGNCTSGIERIRSSTTFQGGEISKLNPWPSNKYLNIWTVTSFDPNASYANAAAYAYKPGFAPSGKDGIISLHTYFGSIGTSNQNNSGTITHEIGHWLNLDHLWGNTNQPATGICGDDQVFDTPETEGHIPGNCPLNDQNCNAGIAENVQNYLEYSYCYKMFTDGQKGRMHAALNSAVGQRSNVVDPANLIATGTDVMLPPCSPIAAICADQQIICEGGQATFRSSSTNLDLTGNTFLWTVNGATSSNPNAENATFTFPAAGTYDATLTVTHAGGNNSSTLTAAVFVFPAVAGTAAPFAEDFETIVVPGNDWVIINNGAGASTWQQSSIAAHSGTKSMRLQNFQGNTGNTTDEFYTPNFSTLNTTNIALTFWVAYAARVSSSTDALKGYGSVNCGNTWGLRYNKIGTALSTTGALVQTNFTPTAAQWRQDNFNSLSAYSNKSSVRFRFDYTYVNGNNLYIDDINLTGTVGVEQLNVNPDDVSVYPNPAGNITTVKLTLERKSNVEVTVLDVLGKTVYSRIDNELEPNEYLFDIPLDGISAGVYFIKLNAGGQQLTEKLVVN